METPSITERIQELIAELNGYRQLAADGKVDFDGRNISLAITDLESAESRVQRAGLV